MRPFPLALAQLSIVAIAAAAWTALISYLAKIIHDRFAGVPLEPTSPDLWVFVAGLLAWIAAAIIASRYSAVTVAAKIATWLVLPSMVLLWTWVLLIMRLP
ncbi:MAG: hypothetical protein J0L64_15640 [Acidobacteria bacterium]|nr:hypothetical protein [Acidobacteriota bacterium]